MQYFMVLNDGETYTALDGCKIVAVANDIADSDSNDIDMVVKYADNPGVLQEIFSLHGEKVETKKLVEVITRFGHSFGD